MLNHQLIQKLRQQTGAGLMDIKKALEQANGDENKTLAILKERSQEIAEKKQIERETKAGLIEAYGHATGQVAVLVHLTCETDFVAKNEAFKQLAHDLAMQVAAMNPPDLSALLEQNFIKDEQKTVQALINETTARLGEKIEVKRFVRFEV